MSTRKHNVPYLIFICAIASISGIILGYDASVISGVIDPLTEHLSLSPAESGWAVSNVILGCIAGARGRTLHRPFWPQSNLDRHNYSVHHFRYRVGISQ